MATLRGRFSRRRKSRGMKYAVKVFKPLRGDHWINGAFDDGKDFGGATNFSNSFLSFSQKFCISAITKH